jgi:hypothetical protein
VLVGSGKSLQRGRGSTACAVDNPLKKWLFVQRKYFVLFLNNQAHIWLKTANVVPYPSPLEFPGWVILFFNERINHFTSWPKVENKLASTREMRERERKKRTT